jgi:LmbE family N-acetylglucosaminyl deacetylase
MSNSPPRRNNDRNPTAVRFDGLDQPVCRVLCLGAHPDDIEIGCGGTLLKLMAQARQLLFHWVVFSSDPAREYEAIQSANRLLRHHRKTVVVHKFRDGFLPFSGSEIKDAFEELKQRFSPDLILTHHRDDLHQDHRLVSELTWNTFRHHTILEYEIPKYDGDMGAPNLFVPLDESLCRKKIDHLMTHFASQVPKRWFKEDLFSGLLRLRGMECNSPTSFAEAFYSRKAILT